MRKKYPLNYTRYSAKVADLADISTMENQFMPGTISMKRGDFIRRIATAKSCDRYTVKRWGDQILD
jgi:hypothetical protein